MKTWSEALRDGAISGSLASIASTAVLAACSELENGTPYAPSNATSHCFWGNKAMRQDGPSVRYTATGYGVHHLSAVFWASLYEKLFGQEADRGNTTPALVGGGAVAALACLVDYQLTPPRLRPGYEERLSKTALALVYGALGVSFAARGLFRSRRFNL
jgi:hypothetical protein